MDICYNKGQDVQACKADDYLYVYTNKNVADQLSTALTNNVHGKFTTTMGLR